MLGILNPIKSNVLYEFSILPEMWFLFAPIALTFSIDTLVE